MKSNGNGTKGRMKSNGNGTGGNLLDRLAANLPGLLKEARQVDNRFALGAVCVVGVIAIILFLLAPAMRIIKFPPVQVLILVGMLLAALVALAIFGPRKDQGPTEVDRPQPAIPTQIPVLKERDFESIAPPNETS